MATSDRQIVLYHDPLGRFVSRWRECNPLESRGSRALRWNTILREYGAKVSGISAHEDGNMMKVTVFHNDVDSFWVNSFKEDEVFVGGVYHFGIKTKCACYTDLTFPRTVSKLTVHMELCH